METLKKDANALSIQLQVKAMELNSCYVCVCNCVCHFETNFDVELKLFHFICLCRSSFSVCLKKIPHHTSWNSDTNQKKKKKITHFTFCKKVLKRFRQHQKEINTAFLHSAITELEKALTICTYGMAFSSTKNRKKNV